MRDALSLLDQCIAFYLGQELTFDKVLEVLGTVDTEVFSKLLRKVLEQDVTSCIHILEDLLVNGKNWDSLSMILPGICEISCWSRHRKMRKKFWMYLRKI